MARLVLLVVGVNAALGIAAFLGARAAVRRVVWGVFGKPPPPEEEERR